MDALITQIQEILANEYLMKSLIRQAQVFNIYIMIGVLLVAILFQWNDDRKNKKIFVQRKEVKKSKLQDILFINRIHENFDIIGKEKHRKAKFADTATIVCVAGSVLFGLFMTSQGQIAMGLISPFGLLWMFKKLTGLLITSKNEYVLRDLPEAIDRVKRSLTKYDDLRSVLYSAAEYLDEPFKGMFQDLSKRMNTETSEDVLDSFMRKQNNLWLYSFAFSLLSYVQTAGKAQLNEQLDDLKGIVLKEGAQRNAERVERKMTVAVNYVLCAVAIVGCIANLLFSPSARILFFSTPFGAAAFIGGIIMVIISIFSNLLIGSGKGGK